MQAYRLNEYQNKWEVVGEEQDYSIMVNTTSFSAWTVSDDVNPLPIKLISFTAKEEQSNALLHWVTPLEKNNKGFYVEKSADGKNFSQIGFVPGNENIHDQSEYEFTDRNFIQNSYYRLNQVDYNGENEYSHIVFLNHSCYHPQSTFTIYPNPIDERFL